MTSWRIAAAQSGIVWDGETNGRDRYATATLCFPEKEVVAEALYIHTLPTSARRGPTGESPHCTPNFALFSPIHYVARHQLVRSSR